MMLYGLVINKIYQAHCRSRLLRTALHAPYVPSFTPPYVPRFMPPYVPRFMPPYVPRFMRGIQSLKFAPNPQRLYQTQL